MEMELIQVLAKIRRGLWLVRRGSEVKTACGVIGQAEAQLCEMLSRGYDVCVAPVGAQGEPCGIFACGIHAIGEGT